MMKIYICPNCGWMRLVSRRSTVECWKCGNEQMRLTNLDIGKYASMPDNEREDYAKAWLYIHNRQKDNLKWRMTEKSVKRKREQKS